MIMKKFHKFTVITTLLGIILLLYSVYSLYQINKFVSSSVKTNGSVTSINLFTIRDKSPQTNLHSYTSVKVRFTTLKGKTIEFDSDAIDMNPPQYKVGEILTVYYNPNNPNEAKVDSLTSLWFPMAASGLVGLFTFFLGIISTKFRWDKKLTRKDKLEAELHHQASHLLRYILLFLLLAITSVFYIMFNKSIAGNLLLGIPFYTIGIFIIALMAKSFLDIFTSLRKAGKILHTEVEESLLKITVKGYQNPLFLKYKLILPVFFASSSAIFLYFFLIEKVGPLLTTVTLLFIVIGGTLESLSLLFSLVTTIIGRKSLSTEIKIIWNKGLIVTEWDTIIPYLKKIEFREKDKCVIIYTSQPWAYQQDNFSPFQYFIGPIWGRVYANYFIPVNNKNNAEQIITLIEQINNNSKSLKKA